MFFISVGAGVNFAVHKLFTKFNYVYSSGYSYI
jgi:hypothetical protein